MFDQASCEQRGAILDDTRMDSIKTISLPRVKIVEYKNATKEMCIFTVIKSDTGSLSFETEIEEIATVPRGWNRGR